ncbi:hypothetical protein AB0B66_10470 [Catellatospora sp. NPDC049111]|uniref:hypothetical protein n=1 Tax=Catellatospora sp. NPDC049111 TaxID=3155271 RepID=UPI0034039736
MIRQLHSDYAAAWPQIVEDVQRIVDDCAELGIVIAGPDGTGDPQIDIANGICFNGDADTDSSNSPLRIPPPLADDGNWPDQTAVHFQVDTGAMPYDLAVRTALLRLLRHAGDAARLAEADGDWAEAIHMHLRLFGPLNDRIRSVLDYATQASPA